jgi:hypothetical protein
MFRDEIGPWLRARGFKKRRNRFRRVDEDGWQVIDFQASQWGSRDDVRFTINLWVGSMQGRCLPWLEARRSLDDLMAMARNAPDEFPRYALGRFSMLLERSGLRSLASEVPD